MLKEAKAGGVTLAQLLKRPEVQIEMLAPVLAMLMPAFFERDISIPASGISAAGEQQVPPLGLKSSVGMTTITAGRH
jgi:hypothetical protein